MILSQAEELHVRQNVNVSMQSAQYQFIDIIAFLLHELSVKKAHYW